MWTQNWQAYQYINDRLPEGILRKMSKCHCPEDCESLTAVYANQAVRDNLSSSAYVRSERR